MYTHILHNLRYTDKINLKDIGYVQILVELPLWVEAHI